MAIHCRKLGGRVRLVKVVIVVDKSRSNIINNDWSIGADKHGYAPAAASGPGVSLGIDSDISGKDYTEAAYN